MIVCVKFDYNQSALQLLLIRKEVIGMGKVWAMYFSGTGGTEKIAKTISETIGKQLNIHN